MDRIGDQAHDGAGPSPERTRRSAEPVAVVAVAGWGGLKYLVGVGGMRVGVGGGGMVVFTVSQVGSGGVPGEPALAQNGRGPVLCGKRAPVTSWGCG